MSREVENKGVFRFNHLGKYAEAFNQVGIGRMVVYLPAYPSKSCHHQIYQYHSCGMEDKMILMRCTKTEAEIPEIICCSSPHFGKYVLGEGSINFSFSFQFCTVPTFYGVCNIFIKNNSLIKKTENYGSGIRLCSYLGGAIMNISSCE